jgi:hypothetical protein
VYKGWVYERVFYLENFKIYTYLFKKLSYTQYGLLR